MAKLTEAQKRANKKWNDAHKKRMNYIRRRSDSKNFILKYADEEDLDKIIDHFFNIWRS